MLTMNTLSHLNRIKILVDKLQRQVGAAIAAEIATAKPVENQPHPDPSQGLAWKIAQVWDSLKLKNGFRVRTVRKLLENDPGCRFMSDSSFSAILSRWAQDRYLEIVEQGSGRRPTVYRVRSK